MNGPASRGDSVNTGKFSNILTSVTTVSLHKGLEIFLAEYGSPAHGAVYPLSNAPALLLNIFKFTTQ